MVVRVRSSRKSNPSLSSDSLSARRSPDSTDLGEQQLIIPGDNRDANTIPFYDRNDNLPVSKLVTHLCELFFVHLGCSFPFLQPDRFLRDLKNKQVDTILVDAVCALAARFSPHPLLSPPQAPSIDGNEPPPSCKKSDRGLPFAHRAISALVYALSCPTMSVVQACLLLAYEEFGSSHDSGLWMYLGISIRMAQDLGMQKLRGLKYNYGRVGLNPNAVKTAYPVKLGGDQYDDSQGCEAPIPPPLDTDDGRAKERERVDLFWSIFFLDRVISSGTGRPVTLRDEDIELCFPLQCESQLPNGWPSPFPQLIRIIHLYGRVTDLINGIQDANHVTPDTLQRLAGMESDLTGIYQRLSPRLHFNAVNFQTYVRAKEGTNFILLHFWFHTLIVLLHQPTLLNSFGGTMQQLYPNSRELSMSSAKTIADILSFSELVDGKSFIGNPFTSQPMYIAACAFLMESIYYTSPSSRGNSPPPQALLTNQSSGFVMPGSQDRKTASKHTLLASAAKENYQRCYKALKALATYWEGTRYILTVLDQKAKGIVDPLLYTAEEMESAVEMPHVPSIAPPGWRMAGPSQGSADEQGPSEEMEASSDGNRMDRSQAIGWALTGATNSSQPNLSLLYQLPAQRADAASANPTYPSQYSHGQHYLPMHTNASQPPYSRPLESTDTRKYSHLTPNQVTTSDANLLLGLHAPYPNSGSSHPSSGPQTAYTTNIASSNVGNQASGYNYNLPPSGPEPRANVARLDSHHVDISTGDPNLGEVFIESQDIDMNTLHSEHSLPFTLNGEIIPWLEYLPEDVANFFGEHQSYPLTRHDDDHVKPPQ
ncbi:hypothetical protein MAP00_002620 [Monascus purpureus]|nr:hypothetical protein MAP00_002620 [Monascus purpureus]